MKSFLKILLWIELSALPGVAQTWRPVQYNTGTFEASMPRLSLTGPFGLGTNTPRAPFHVVGPVWMTATNGSTNFLCDLNGNVGVGAASPLSKFTVTASTTALGIESVATAALGASSGGGIAARTSAHPTASGQRLGGFFFGSDDGVSQFSPCGLFAYSTELADVGHKGAYLTFETCKTGQASRTEKMRVGNDGNVGIGTNAPGATLHVLGSTFLHGNATNIGAFYLGPGAGPITNILTASGTLDFPITAPQSASDLSLTVTGAADGDTVFLGHPVALAMTNAAWTAYAGPGVVYVRFNNYSTGAIDPPAGTFKVKVIK